MDAIVTGSTLDLAESSFLILVFIYGIESLKLLICFSNMILFFYLRMDAAWCSELLPWTWVMVRLDVSSVLFCFKGYRLQWNLLLLKCWNLSTLISSTMIMIILERLVLLQIVSLSKNWGYTASFLIESFTCLEGCCCLEFWGVEHYFGKGVAVSFGVLKSVNYMYCFGIVGLRAGLVLG